MLPALKNVHTGFGSENTKNPPENPVGFKFKFSLFVLIFLYQFRFAHTY